MKTILTILALTILALIIVTSINAQTNSIPKEYYGMYSATFGDEGSGNEVNYVLFMDSTSNEQNVYKEIFHGSGNKATYYTVKSFNQQNGEMILNSKLTIFFDAESSETTILTDTTGKAKLIFKKNKSNKYYFIDSDGPAPEGIVVLSDAISATILNEKGIRNKLLLNPNIKK